MYIYYPFFPAPTRLFIEPSELHCWIHNFHHFPCNPRFASGTLNKVTVSDFACLERKVFSNTAAVLDCILHISVLKPDFLDNIYPPMIGSLSRQSFIDTSSVSACKVAHVDAGVEPSLPFFWHGCFILAPWWRSSEAHHPLCFKILISLFFASISLWIFPLVLNLIFSKSVPSTIRWQVRQLLLPHKALLLWQLWWRMWINFFNTFVLHDGKCISLQQKPEELLQQQVKSYNKCPVKDNGYVDWRIFAVACCVYKK